MYDFIFSHRIVDFVNKKVVSNLELVPVCLQRLKNNVKNILTFAIFFNNKTMFNRWYSLYLHICSIVLYPRMYRPHGAVGWSAVCDYGNPDHTHLRFEY